MNNLVFKSSEVVNIQDMAETDIFQMLMSRDHVKKTDFLQLCAEKSRELHRYDESLDA